MEEVDSVMLSDTFLKFQAEGIKLKQKVVDTVVMFTPTKNEDEVDTKMIISSIQQYSQFEETKLS